GTNPKIGALMRRLRADPPGLLGFMDRRRLCARGGGPPHARKARTRHAWLPRTAASMRCALLRCRPLLRREAPTRVRSLAAAPSARGANRVRSLATAPSARGANSPRSLTLLRRERQRRTFAAGRSFGARRQRAHV